MSLLKTKSLHLLTSIILLFLLTVITYQGASENQFHLDDYSNILINDSVRITELNLELLSNVAENSLLANRPLPYISFAIDWWRGGGKPKAFQQTNIALHALMTLLVFAFIVCLLQRHYTHNKRLIWFAFFGAALWALHPIQTQAVTYIVQRMTSMAALFSLLSVFAYIRGRLNNGLAQWSWFTVALSAFVLGGLSKENAWVAPAFILLAEFGVIRHKQPLIQFRLDYLWLSLPVIIALYLIVDITSGTGPLYTYTQEGYAIRDFSLTERLLTQPRVIAFHLSQILWPWYERFSLEHDFITSSGLFRPVSTFFALVGLLSWCSLGLWLLFKQSYRIFGFLLLWVPLTLAVESSVIPLEMVFEHRMYLPSVALAALAIFGLNSAWQSSQRTAIIATVTAITFCIFSIFSTTQRILQWESPITLAESALDNAPNSARIRGNLSMRYLLNNQKIKAQDTAELALYLDQNEPTALETLAILSAENNQHQEANKLFRQAYSISKGYNRPDLLFNWGNLQFKMKNYQSAINLYLIAIEMHPSDASYHFRVARAYDALDNCEATKLHLEKVLSLTTNDNEIRTANNVMYSTFQSPEGKCSSTKSRGTP